ncbi:MAG: hypothetical protein RLO21_00005, partial [Nitratireductor sp.]
MEFPESIGAAKIVSFAAACRSQEALFHNRGREGTRCAERECVLRQASVIAVNRHACPGFLLLFAGQRMGCRLMASETGMTISGT